MQAGKGWKESSEPHATEPLSLYTVFDVTAYGQMVSVPRVYKKVSYVPIITYTTKEGSYSGNVAQTITTYPLYTVIVTLAAGVVTNIAYDDGCFFCPANGPLCGYTSFDANASVSAEVPAAAYQGCAVDMATCYPGLGAPATVPGQWLNTSLITPAYNVTSLANVTSLVATVNGTNTTWANVTSLVNVTTTVPAVFENTWAYNATALAAAAAASPSAAPSANATAAPAGALAAAESCDLKIFVVWQGTDANGQYLKSVNKRFSRFRQFSVSTAYQSALNLGQQAVDVSKTAFNVADGIPGAVSRKND